MRIFELIGVLENPFGGSWGGVKEVVVQELDFTDLTLTSLKFMLPTLIKERCLIDPWDIQRHDFLRHVLTFVDDPFVRVLGVDMRSDLEVHS
jgi:hypothetical protein